MVFFETTRMSEKWPFLETTEFNPFLETSRELVSSRAVSIDNTIVFPNAIDEIDGNG